MVVTRAVKEREGSLKLNHYYMLCILGYPRVYFADFLIGRNF